MSDKYNDYLSDHVSNVQKAAKWLFDHDIVDLDTFKIVMRHVQEHDASKFFAPEYEAYDDYFYGGMKTEDIQDAFDYAWLHHIHNNPHHWQYWVLNEDEGVTKPLDMPEEYIIEMIADWWSFSFRNSDLTEIFNWYAEHDKKMLLSVNTRKRVDDILDAIERELEKAEDAEASREKHGDK